MRGEDQEDRDDGLHAEDRPLSPVKEEAIGVIIATLILLICVSCLPQVKSAMAYRPSSPFRLPLGLLLLLSISLTEGFRLDLARPASRPQIKPLHHPK